MLPRIILGVSALAFAGIGVGFIAAADSLLPRVNITAPPGTALTDIRAVYGGLDLGIGCALAFFLLRGEVHLGLVVCAFTLAGLAFGRIIGIAIDPEQDAMTYYLLTSEVMGAALALVGLALKPAQSMGVSRNNVNT